LFLFYSYLSGLRDLIQASLLFSCYSSVTIPVAIQLLFFPLIFSFLAPSDVIHPFLLFILMFLLIFSQRCLVVLIFLPFSRIFFLHLPFPSHSSGLPEKRTLC
jgi:hypothetical protein